MVGDFDVRDAQIFDTVTMLLTIACWGLDRALAAAPNDTGTLYNYAVLLQTKRRDIPAAEELYNKLLMSEPEDAATLHALGNLQLDVHNDYAGAELLLLRAMKITPEDPGLTCDYGRLMQAQGRTLEAEDMYEKTLRFDENHEVALRNYAGILHDKLDEADRAEALYKRLLAVGKTAKAKAGVLCKYARLLQEQKKDYAAAEKMYRQALMYGIMDLDAIKSYAVLLDEIRNDDATSSSLYLTALRSDPTYAGTLFEIAKGRGAVSKERALLVLYNFNTSHAGAAWELGCSHSARGAHRDAVRWYERAVKVDAQYANELCSVGEKYESAGQIDACVRVYEMVLSVAPWHSHCAWRYAGVKEDKKGDAIGADALFQRALEGLGAGTLRSPSPFGGEGNSFGVTTTVRSGWEQELLERGGKREERDDYDGAVRVYRLILGLGGERAGEAARRCGVLMHTVWGDSETAVECKSVPPVFPLLAAQACIHTRM